MVESASKLQAQKVSVTGDIQITGVSMLPTEAFVFAEISTITFADGTSMQVVNQSDPIAASQSGSTSDAEAKPGKLNVVAVN